MPGLGFAEQKLSRQGVFKVRDESPDSVIFTNDPGFSVFSSSASGSVDRCSFGSDGHDHDHDHKSLASELCKNLAGRGLDRQSSCGSDLNLKRSVVHKKNSNALKKRDEGKNTDKTEEENPHDSARHSLSQPPKGCQSLGLRSEALSKKYERQRQASLDLNSRVTDAISSSPRFVVIKKMAASSRGSGTFPSPGAPNYRHGNGGGVGLHKGWSSERVPLAANGNRRYANAIPFPFNNGRTLPSKWEDAEKWIFSPSAGDGVNWPAMAPLPQRRPKSKSGPLGPPGMACHSSSFSPSLVMPMSDGGRAGNFMGSSPFSTGVLGADVLSDLVGCGVGGGSGSAGRGSYPVQVEPSVARSASVHGWSDLLMQSSLPSSEDEKLDCGKDVGTMIAPAVSRRDVATQMSPAGSTCSSPRERLPCPPSLVLAMAEQNHHSSKMEIKDVQVDDCVTVTRWSKKHGSRGFNRGATKIRSWRKKAMETRGSAWEVSETKKSVSKFSREDAKITAWENLQKAKAEAEIRKLEMKLEKIRTSSMDKIMKKLRTAQRKAQEMRSSASASQDYRISRTSNKALFCKSSQMSALSGCFTCHAF